MAYTKEQIIADITDYISKSGVKYWNEVYVGVSKDVKDRLFNGHGVIEQSDKWIYRQATSSAVARDIESYFINTLGATGGTGGGDDTADYVYAYKKESHTDP
ncbi:MAG: hypothetical protein ABII89_02250 [Candidatus Omnitrophota bacterium]